MDNKHASLHYPMSITEVGAKEALEAEELSRNSQNWSHHETF